MAVVAAGCSGNQTGESTSTSTRLDRSWNEKLLVPDPLTADHVDGPIDYSKTPYRFPEQAPPGGRPPVGGAHNPKWLRCGVYDAPVPNEYAVHSLERGAVWLTYRPDLPPAQVRQLAALAEIKGDENRTREYVLVSPFEGIPAPIVAVSWEVWLPVERADDVGLPQFVQAYVGAQGGPGGKKCATDGLTPEEAAGDLARHSDTITVPPA